MKERMNLNMEELGMVNSGTKGESFSLVFRLIADGHGKFVTKDAKVDFAGMKEFFASKGYKFIPSEDDQNIFVDREGLSYGQDYIEYLMDEGNF